MEQEQNAVVYKLTTPTRYDMHPRKTLWKASIVGPNGQECTQWYIQLSPHESPEWERLGDVLERSVMNKDQGTWDKILQSIID